jgi:hypothetical protein
MVWGNIRSFVLIGLTMVVIALFGFMFLMAGWSAITHPTPLKGLTSTASETIVAGVFSCIIGISAFVAGVEIIRRIINYPKKWSTGVL